jgi:multiple sugar transport system permease protein
VTATTAAAPAVRVTDRALAERRLGWLLVAPALVAMVGVTAYPLARAVWLSLYSYRITDPGAREFVGLRNYGVVLSDSLWWSDVATTVLITVITVAVELVVGFAFASVMHRIVFGRRLIRTSILLPYGIITVVAAFAWRYAFALDSGFVNGLLGLDDFAWFGQRGSALFVIALAEIWKTTPFMSLLLLEIGRAHV